MSEDVGRVLDLLNNPKLSRLYELKIREMQPADLVKRLENEKVSTRGHMPELRGRLLRLEARKLGLPKVPWYKEDDNTSKRTAIQRECAKVQGAKVYKKIKELKVKEMTKDDNLLMKKSRAKDVKSESKNWENNTKGYTERVLNGAADALNKMLGSISENVSTFCL